MIGSGNWTLDPQKDHAARPENRTLDQLKRSFVRWYTRPRNTIAQMIANVIARAIVKITCAQMHEHVPRGTRRPDDGRRPDRLNDGQTDRIFWIFRIFSDSQESWKKMHVAPNASFCTQSCTKNLGHNQDLSTRSIRTICPTYTDIPKEGIRSICLQVCPCGKHTTGMVYHVNYMITVDFHFHFWLVN